MGQGQGSISVNQKAPVIPVPPPPGPPFAAGSAINGLSLDPVLSAIVFGNDIGALGDPAQFLSDREIEMANFLFRFINAGNRQFVIDPLNGVYQMGDIDAAGNDMGIEINDVAETIVLGDLNGVASGMNLLMDNLLGGPQLEFGNNNGIFFRANRNSDLYQLGDIDADNNGNFVAVDDGIQEWSIGQRAAVTNLLLHKPSVGIGLSFFDSVGNNPFLLPDPATGGIAFMSAPDFATQVALSDAGSGRLAQLGNIGASNNGNVFTVDDNNNLFDITNTALNAVVRINGVNGFTGVVAPPLTITVDGGIVTNVA